ncbi:MAG: SDR family NAD(P)-dependent oxidoreductase [Chthoniobacteraceae bacterium]
MNTSALIIGASSGIGLEIAKVLSARGYRIGIAARRQQLLEQYAATHPNVVQFQAFDITSDDAVERFHEMSRALGTVDYVYIASGVGFINESLDWGLEEITIQTNALGFAKLSCAAMRIFETQGHGHLVGISSVAALRGAGEAPAYGASKAFVSRYLQALRMRAKRSGLPIYVTDIRPGFVDTAMMKAKSPFWISSPQKAAQQIVNCADKRRPISYLTKRWSVVGWLLKHLPE